MDWPWYLDINTKVLFIHMLLKANWKDGRFRDITVPRGSFVSSIAKLAEETGLTNDEVRTAISHLIHTKEITKRSTNKYTVFTVINYALYQDTTERIPSRPQSVPLLFPTIEEEQEEKEILDSITKDDTICPEPEQSAPHSSGISLPLNDKSLYNVTLDKIALWGNTYPAVNVEQELRRMIAWLEANPAKRKTRRGIERFINGWLARTQDSGSKGQKEVRNATHGHKEDSRSFSL